MFCGVPTPLTPLIRGEYVSRIRLTSKQNMDFQTRCNRYLQQIRRTQESTAATPELSLFPHLQALLEEFSLEHFRRETIRFVQEPRRLKPDWETRFRGDGRLTAHRLH